MTRNHHKITEHRNVKNFEDLPEEDVFGLEACIYSAFSGGVTREDAHAHMKGDQVLIAHAQRDGDRPKVVGFSSTSLISPRGAFGGDALSGKTAGYFAAAAIDAEYQAHGIYGQLFERRFDYVKEHGLDRIFTRTQNPAVFKGLSRGVDHLVQLGRVRSYRFGQQVFKGLYGCRLMANMRDEFPYISTDDGDALVFTWDLEY